MLLRQFARSCTMAVGLIAVTATPAFSCACCVGTAWRKIEVEKLDGPKLAEIEQVRFAVKAKLMLGEADDDGIKGVDDPSEVGFAMTTLTRTIMTTRRRFLTLAGAALATPALSRRAPAQAWPTRNIRAMIPFSAGSTIDIIGRLVLDPLSRQLGQTIVVENRGGAGGTIGTAIVAKAEPDGYTLLIHAAAHSAAPAAYPNIAYNPASDFAAVIPFGTVPNVTVVAPASGIKTLKDLVAKAKGGSLSYASAGVGSATHWAAERLRVSAGFTGVHVPFRGGPEALTEVVTGRVDFTCMGIASALPHINDGKLVPLAVSTPKRSAALPNVPTTIEAGYADSDYNFWMGMFVPAKTPRAVVDRLYQETQKALRDPNVVEKFKPQGVEPLTLTPAEFDALVKKEIEANLALVKAAGLKFN